MLVTRRWKIGDQITLTEARAFPKRTMNMPVEERPYMGQTIKIPSPPGTLTIDDEGTIVVCTWISEETYEVTDVR